MKIKTGFVSNSSSESFVCDVCGDIRSGWDAIPSELGFQWCENEHYFCEEHLKGDVVRINSTAWGECVSTESCPVCSLIDVRDSDLLEYCLKKLGTSESKLKNKIKKEFNNLQELKKYLKG